MPYEILVRRPSDVASCFGDPATAFDMLGWRAGAGIERMVRIAGGGRWGIRRDRLRVDRNSAVVRSRS